jgi:hypothetical protein
MGIYRRIGNFGIVDTPAGLATFSIGANFTGFDNAATYNFTMPRSWYEERIRVGEYEIIPMGYNNELPNELQELLDEFYSGEGILGKIQGLQWGEGPRLYREVYTEDGDIVRKFIYDKEVIDWLKSWDYENEILKCHTDLVHGLGFFFKVFRNRGARLGDSAKVVDIKHVQVDKCRLEAPELNTDYSKRIIVGTFPNPRIDTIAAYPIFDKQNPTKYPVSMGYSNIYSFCKSFYSTPRFYGAISWIKLASNIAPLLSAYNTNASAISFHIESPDVYWREAEQKLRDNCALKGIPYTEKMLEDFKDEAFRQFSSSLTGTENVGKFLHTTQLYDDIGSNFVGWKITPLDKKIKDYVDAQISIANKADSAATSGFGLHPSLSNIMVDGKMASGSEMLYALKAYIASETAIPEMILFSPFNAILEANFPEKNLKLGFYRKIVMKEDQVTPSNRVVNNA